MNNEYFLNSYANFLKRFFKPKRKLKVIFDCSNGTAGIILKKLLNSKLRIKDKNTQAIIHNSKFIILNSKPDGNFPAHGPNPLAAGAALQLEREVRRSRRWSGTPNAKRIGADLGIIFDADGDRVFFVDDRGRLTDAHEIGFALMQMFKPPYVVSTIASWRLRNVRGSVLSPVGHYFFKSIMRQKKASVGLEHSGHFYFRNFFWCDSGILAAILMMNFVSGLENGLAEWLDSLPKYFRSGEINFSAQGGPTSGWKEGILKKIEKKYSKKASKISNLDGLTLEFGKDFWINVRPSNTENLLRLNIEAKNGKIMETELKKIRKVITLK